MTFSAIFRGFRFERGTLERFRDYYKPCTFFFTRMALQKYLLADSWLDLIDRIIATARDNRFYVPWLKYVTVTAFADTRSTEAAAVVTMNALVRFIIRFFVLKFFIWSPSVIGTRRSI